MSKIENELAKEEPKESKLSKVWLWIFILTFVGLYNFRNDRAPRSSLRFDQRSVHDLNSQLQTCNERLGVDHQKPNTDHMKSWPEKIGIYQDALFSCKDKLKIKASGF